MVKCLQDGSRLDLSHARSMRYVTLVDITIGEQKRSLAMTLTASPMSVVYASAVRKHEALVPFRWRAEVGYATCPSAFREDGVKGYTAARRVLVIRLITVQRLSASAPQLLSTSQAARRDRSGYGDLHASRCFTIPHGERYHGPKVRVHARQGENKAVPP